jgi:hypothetical protein
MELLSLLRYDIYRWILKSDPQQDGQRFCGGELESEKFYSILKRLKDISYQWRSLRVTKAFVDLVALPRSSPDNRENDVQIDGDIADAVNESRDLEGWGEYKVNAPQKQTSAPLSRQQGHTTDPAILNAALVQLLGEEVTVEAGSDLARCERRNRGSGKSQLSLVFYARRAIAAAMMYIRLEDVDQDLGKVASDTAFDQSAHTRLVAFVCSLLQLLHAEGSESESHVEEILPSGQIDDHDDPGLLELLWSLVQLQQHNAAILQHQHQPRKWSKEKVWAEHGDGALGLPPVVLASHRLISTCLHLVLGRCFRP